MSVQVNNQYQLREALFMQNLFQVSQKTNFTIENLPALSALLYQAAQLTDIKLVTRPQFSQIAIKFCSLSQLDADIMFDLFCAQQNVKAAEPRLLIAFLFTVLFKSTVSSRRQKILAADLWPQQSQTLETLLENYLRSCETILAQALCCTTQNEEPQKMRADSNTHKALQLIFREELLPKTAMDLAALASSCVCTRPEAEVEQLTKTELLLENIKNRTIVYEFQQSRRVVCFNLAQTVLYLTGQVESITLVGCRNIKIYAPIVSGVFSISNSKAVNASCCCRFLKVFHSDDLRLNVSCVSSCVQDSQFQTISCAPFNLIYTNLAEKLQQQDIDVLTNFKQLQIVNALGTEHGQCINNAADFVTQIFPFGDHSQAKLAVSLGEPFKGFLQNRVEKLKQFQQKMDGLDDEQRVAFENDLKIQLESWITQKGLSGEAGQAAQAEVKVV